MSEASEMHNHPFKPNKKGKIGFRFAWSGISFLFKSQFNARIHLLAAIIVLIMGFLFQISRTEWIMVILCITLVFVAEMINTALELLTDLVSPGYNEKAGKIKDVAAGAVLVSAVAALLVGLIIFIPRILATFGILSGI